MMTLFPHLLHGLQPYLEGDELLSQHQQMSHEKEVSVQHAAGSTHTVCPHLQSNHTKLDTEDTQHDKWRRTREGERNECKDMNECKGVQIRRGYLSQTCAVEMRGK